MGSAGQREEHVVEVWRLDRDGLDTESSFVDLVEQVSQRLGRAVGWYVEDERGTVGLVLS